MQAAIVHEKKLSDRLKEEQKLKQMLAKMREEPDLSANHIKQDLNLEKDSVSEQCVSKTITAVLSVDKKQAQIEVWDHDQQKLAMLPTKI